MITATISACPPLTIGASPSRTPDICVSGNKKALQEIQKYPGSTVILVARWSAYLLGKYDVAILHLDQQCIEDGILAVGKGSVYRKLVKVAY